MEHSITKPIQKTLTGALLLGFSLLTACSSLQKPTPEAQGLPANQPPSAHFEMATDPQQCLSEVECSLKTARTLLFVYDYAALGAPLMQRTDHQLSSPTDLRHRDWPVVRIQLPRMQGEFAFSSACLARQCRYSSAELLSVYRRYLAGEPCVLPGDARRNCALVP